MRWTLLAILCVLAAGMALAAGPGTSEGQGPDGTVTGGMETPPMPPMQNGTPTELPRGQPGDRIQMTAEHGADVETIREQVREREQAMAQELDSMDAAQQKVFRNQNAVREAVMALHALGDVQGIGPNVSAIARGFNNSIQATIQAELEAERRSGIARFFAGGDREAGQVLAQEAAQNQERIRELQRLHDECDCSQDVKAMLQEQVTALEQEQTRLQERADKELKSKGLFGWIWK